MAENESMGVPAAGGGGAARGSKVRQPSKFIHFVIHSHGSVPFGQCANTFKVPQNMSVGFFYDPFLGRSTVCFSSDKIQQICYGTIDAPYKYEHPHDIPNILLERMDDIQLPTGIFNCNEGKFIEIPSLGPVSPQPYVAGALQPSACLETVVFFLRQSYPDYFIAITVLACGVTTRYPIHPARKTIVYPEVGAKEVSAGNKPKINSMYSNYIKRGYSPSEALQLAVHFVRRVDGGAGGGAGGAPAAVAPLAAGGFGTGGGYGVPLAAGGFGTGGGYGAPPAAGGAWGTPAAVARPALVAPFAAPAAGGAWGTPAAVVPFAAPAAGGFGTSGGYGAPPAAVGKFAAWAAGSGRGGRGRGGRGGSGFGSQYGGSRTRKVNGRRRSTHRRGKN